MIIFSKKRSPPSPPQLTLYGHPIPTYSELKFLGVLFDSRLSWIPHIRNLKSKCLRIINIMKYLSNHNYGCSTKRLIHLYKSLILPRLDYGSQLYKTANKTVLGLLDTIQSTALRIATGAFWTSPSLSLCAETSIMPLHYRRIKLTTNLLLSIA